MAKGGASSTPQTVTQTTSNIGEAQRPYYNQLMQRAGTMLSTPYIPYGYTQNEQGQVVRAVDPTTGKPVSAERIAGFTPQQQAIQQQVAGMQAPSQFGMGTNFLNQAAQGTMAAAKYDPTKFTYQTVNAPGVQQYSMAAPKDVAAQQVVAQNMQAAQSTYNPNLRYFRMEGPQQFGAYQAAQYMSPFIQQALEPQMREAVYSAKRGQLAEDLGAARQGTYGGSRQLLAAMERERNLGQQMGDIYGRGMQAAYESAQQQFERDRAAQQAAQRANLEASLGVQQLGTTTGLQVALANLDKEQQARVNNQALQFQASGMNAENALRAALANQQMAFNVGQQNLQSQLTTQDLGVKTGLQALLANQQANLDAQRAAEQSRQFGAQNALQAYSQMGQYGQTAANIGAARQQADLARLGMQQSTAAQEQALNQQRLDMAYQDFLTQRDYPYTQLQRYGNLLSAVPQATSQTTAGYAQSPSLAQQIMGTGLGALGMYKTLAG